MKIFEKIQWSDGGHNDKGEVIGYLRAPSLGIATKALNVDHNFIQCREISKREYLRRRKKAEIALSMFNLERQS